MRITENTTLEPRTYYLPEGITIAGDNLTLEGNGATLVGNSTHGTGVRLSGQKKVTLKNLRILDYEYGIQAKDCANLAIIGNKITATGEIDANSIFLDIFKGPEEAYPGGILLHGVRDSLIEANDLQHQMNGLLSYHCRKLTVRDNLANYCSGFGFHLYDTNNSLFEANYADFCSRWNTREDGRGHMGADAAGFVIVYNSSKNVFRNNFARLGGDGFFLAGLTHSLEYAPCNDNLFEENDASWSPNIAFEATFSSGNIFRRNIANSCNYGFWLGFSQKNTLEANQVLYNRRAGIAAENAINMTARDNDFRHNAYAVLLWSKHILQFAEAVPQNDTSRHWLIENNHFSHNHIAVRIAANQDHGVRPHIGGKCPPPTGHTLKGNTYANNQADFEAYEVEDTDIQDLPAP